MLGVQPANSRRKCQDISQCFESGHPVDSGLISVMFSDLQSLLIPIVFCLLMIAFVCVTGMHHCHPSAAHL